MSDMTRRGFLGLLGKALAIGAVAAAVPEILEASAPPVDGLGSGLACPNAVGIPGPQGVAGCMSPQGLSGISCPNAVGCTGQAGPTGVFEAESCAECRNLSHDLDKRGAPLTWRGHRILPYHELDRVIFPYGPEPY